MKVIAGLLCLAVVSGCDQIEYSNQYRVGIDPAFQDDYQEEILQALEEWETKVGTHQLHFVVSVGSCDRSDGPHLICLHPASDAWFTTNDPGGHIGTTETGYGTSSSNLYLKTAALQDPVLRCQTIRHEIGHALGLVHYNLLSPIPPGKHIMGGNPGAATEHITCEDVQQFMSYRHFAWGPQGDFCQDPKEPSVSLQVNDNTTWD